MSDHDPIADLELLLAPPPRLIGHDHGFRLGKPGEFTIVEDQVAFARIRNARRAAAQRLADAAKLIKHEARPIFTYGHRWLGFK